MNNQQTNQKNIEQDCRIMVELLTASYRSRVTTK
jgi:hypothetical protein